MNKQQQQQQQKRRLLKQLPPNVHLEILLQKDNAQH